MKKTIIIKDMWSIKEEVGGNYDKVIDTLKEACSEVEAMEGPTEIVVTIETQ